MDRTRSNAMHTARLQLEDMEDRLWSKLQAKKDLEWQIGVLQESVTILRKEYRRLVEWEG